jgi:hypothetical protein
VIVDDEHSPVWLHAVTEQQVGCHHGDRCKSGG